MQDGHASIKIFTTDITGRAISAAWCRTATSGKRSRSSRAQGGIACIHAEDNDIVMFMYEKLMRENRVSFEHMAEVHNALSEELSFNRVIRLAENVEGAALYMVHVWRRPAWRHSKRRAPRASRCTARRCTST